MRASLTWWSNSCGRLLHTWCTDMWKGWVGTRALNFLGMAINDTLWWPGSIWLSCPNLYAKVVGNVFVAFLCGLMLPYSSIHCSTWPSIEDKDTKEVGLGAQTSYTRLVFVRNDPVSQITRAVSTSPWDERQQGQRPSTQGKAQHTPCRRGSHNTGAGSSYTVSLRVPAGQALCTGGLGTLTAVVLTTIRHNAIPTLQRAPIRVANHLLRPSDIGRLDYCAPTKRCSTAQDQAQGTVNYP